jgi:hypothetical protein
MLREVAAMLIRSLMRRLTIACKGLPTLSLLPSCSSTRGGLLMERRLGHEPALFGRFPGFNPRRGCVGLHAKLSVLLHLPVELDPPC